MSIEAPPAPTTRPNPAQRLGGVIVAPDPTLRDIAARPDWVVPLIVVLLISLASTLLSTPRVDVESTLREQWEEQGMTAEQIEQNLELVAKIQKFTVPITAAVVPLFLLIMAAALLLAFKVMGGEGTFKQSWSMCLYSQVPLIFKAIIATVLIVRAGTVTAEEAQTMLKSSLGFLADPGDSPALFAFLSSIDIFNIWSVVLLGIGFAYAHQTSRVKAFAIILTLWAVVILGKVGLGALRGMGGPS